MEKKYNYFQYYNSLKISFHTKHFDYIQLIINYNSIRTAFEMIDYKIIYEKALIDYQILNRSYNPYENRIYNFKFIELIFKQRRLENG